MQQINTVAMLLPRFQNPAGQNNCWFNSVLQIVLHALRKRSNAPDFPHVPTHDFARYGEVITAEMDYFCSPGIYNVSSICRSLDLPKRTVKQVMLLLMGFTSLNDQNNQYDAAQCLQTLLGSAKHLSFLWHLQEDKFRCADCGNLSTLDVPHSVIPIDISNHMHASNKKFSGQQAIKHYFEGTESGIERFCQDCHSRTCSKSINLCGLPDFLLIQFKRFWVKRTARTTVMQKIKATSTPFSSVDLNLQDRTITYKVIASIDHIGEQIVQGHYVAHINHQNQWFRCDDDRIVPLGANSHEPTANSYIILLQLQNQQ